MEPQKSGRKREMVVCEHVDRFMRQPTGPHTYVKGTRGGGQAWCFDTFAIFLDY